MSEKPTFEELNIRISRLEAELSRYAQVETELKRSLQFTESLLTAIPTPIFIKDAQGRYLDCNPAFTEVMGVAKQELSGKTVMELWPSEHAEMYHQKDIELMENPTRQVYDFEIQDKYGTTRPVIFSKNVFHDECGNIAGLVGGFIDITEHKQAEEALRESEEKYRDIFNSLVDVYFKTGLNGTIENVSPSAETILGYSAAELIGKKTDILYQNPKDRERFLNELKEKGRVRGFELLFKRKSGELYHISVNAGLNFNADGEPLGLSGTIRDITERKRMEDALMESEERFRTLVEKSPLGISLIDNNGLYKYINPQFTHIFGYTIEEIPTGTTWFRKSFPEKNYRQKVIQTWTEDQKRITVGQAKTRTFTVTSKDGSRKEIYFLSVKMENLDQFMIYEDITEKSKLEHQLQQSQKFEAIGTLAGGVAHDFNNLLMGIQGRASLMTLDMVPSHPSQEHIKAIEEYVQSATGLTKQLLGLARGGRYEVKPINLNELVNNSATMFGRTRKEISIHTKMQEPSLVVEADHTQIEQVLLNMYVNAWQAMPANGALYLEAKSVELDEDYCKPYAIKAGLYSKVSVTDTGIGMDETTRQRVFDPFFTTKEMSRGTGLGLASAYGIIQNHGGIITVYSEAGHGTTFNIYLPLSDKEVHQAKIQEHKVVQGVETILLVDDEEMIIDVGKSMLEKLGYRVVVSKNGLEAVKQVRSLVDEIDLVILDMIMPEMGGGKSFDHIREIQPKMPVILSSGYAINGQATEIMQRGCNGFIQKPFNISELSKKIRKVLNQAKS